MKQKISSFKTRPYKLKRLVGSGNAYSDSAKRHATSKNIVEILPQAVGKLLNARK